MCTTSLHVVQSYENRQRAAKDKYLTNKAAYEATKRKPDAEEEAAPVRAS